MLEVLCGQMIGTLVCWFAFFNGQDTMPLWFKIGMLIFCNVMLFISFLQSRSPDKESYTLRIWK